MTEKGEKKIVIDFEPYRPVNVSIYFCDGKFHTEDLRSLLQTEDRFGFVVMDGNGCLFGTLQGAHKEVLMRYTVDLPKKHSKGGQSAPRFGRLRLEKRQNYLRKVAEQCGQMFIKDNKVTVQGIIVAGAAELKNNIMSNENIDYRLPPLVLKTVDVCQGEEPGFNHAIELSQDVIGGLKFIKEKKLLSGFFNEISLDTGKFVYGVNETMRIFDTGAIETLILWENLEWNIIQCKLPDSDVLNTIQAKDGDEKKLLIDQGSGIEREIVEKQLLADWILEHQRDNGIKVEFVTDRSAEGNQFCMGFGGIGGVLRYKVDENVFDQGEYYSDMDEDDFI